MAALLRQRRLVGAAIIRRTISSGRPSALCDGCHSVNYDIKTKTVTEWNVGCEKCHGPGSEHVKHPTSANIVNPARDGLRGGERYLHPMPFAGPSAD